MNTWKESFGHCNFDHGSKGMIAVAAQGSLLTVCVQHWLGAELGMERWSNSTTRLHASVWWFVHPELERQFPYWCHWPEAFFIGATAKRILGKFLWCNRESDASIPSKPWATNCPSEHSGKIFRRPVQHQIDGMPYAPSSHSKMYFKNKRKEGHNTSS